MFSDQWLNIKPLPGTGRLINHLKGHDIPVAVASNSPKASIESKISYHTGWKESFSAIIGGDEVQAGKLSPEIFLEAVNRLKVEPSSSLVIEESGVTAGKAAGMEVVAVPYLPKQSQLYTSADEGDRGNFTIRTLAYWGAVIKGFGRGSKVLGIPTANLSTQGYTTLLSEHPSGVYFGWAGLPARGVYKMVMNIGWNPYFNNKEKTIEPWLLHEFDEDFYGEELNLVIVGYIRPEIFKYLSSLEVEDSKDVKSGFSITFVCY